VLDACVRIQHAAPANYERSYEQDGATIFRAVGFMWCTAASSFFSAALAFFSPSARAAALALTAVPVISTLWPTWALRF